MLRFTISRIAIATTASAVVLRTAAAQVTHQVALSAGRAFMLDLDDPDPSGSYSVKEFSSVGTPAARCLLGVEAGVHEYPILRQDIAPDVTGWSSKPPV